MRCPGPVREDDHRDEPVWQERAGSPTMKQRFRCPTCLDGELRVFFRAPDVPAHCNLRCRSRERALAALRGDIELGFCDGCGMIYNAAFDASLVRYTADYENALHFSSEFVRYADDLVDRLVQRHGLYGKRIIEIGCGDGEFLRRLCAAGDNRGIGFDTSFTGPDPDRIEVIRDTYSAEHADREADFYCCRHVLEHVADPRKLLTTVRESIGDRPGVAVYFEVPNGLFTLRELGIWDVIYEHCSYFVWASLCRLFTETGFRPVDIAPAFNGQFLSVEALPRSFDDHEPTPGSELGDLPTLVDEFGAAYARKLDQWEQRLESWASLEETAVVWGAGSKGVTFLNVLDNAPSISRAVDINPRKQGLYVNGSGHEIVAPEILRRRPPRHVIAMNPNYREEIQSTLDKLGVHTEITTA